MFSVVIPLYNKAHTITNTIQTVIDQSFECFEVVIINDGSTDNSIEVVKGFTSDKRIRIINQKNKGVSEARNTGVRNATYNHIAFLDGDDEWFPDYLKKMNEAIEEFPEFEFFCSAGMSKNADGYGKPRQIDKYEGKITLFDFFENPHVFLHIGAVVVTKSLFNKAGGFPLGMKRNEDFTFLYKTALLSRPVYSGFPLSVYVGGVDGQATSITIYEDEKLLNDTIDRFNIVYATYFETGKKDKVFVTFMKYELRHFFMMNTLKKEFSVNNYFLNHLDSNIIQELNALDVFLLKNSKKYSKTHLLYIKITKAVWRLRGFQVIK